MVNPVLLIVVPLGLAFAIPLFTLLWKGAAKYIPPVALGFNLIVSLLLLPRALENPVIVSIGGWRPPFCINLVAGPVGILFSTIIALVGLLVSIYALDYIKEARHRRAGSNRLRRPKSIICSTCYCLPELPVLFSQGIFSTFLCSLRFSAFHPMPS